MPNKIAISVRPSDSIHPQQWFQGNIPEKTKDFH